MTAPITLASLDEPTLTELYCRYGETTDAETRTRYQMLLLSLRGQTSSQIAQTVLRSQDTVVRVLTRSFTGGLNAVPRRTAPGRDRRVTAAWEAERLARDRAGSPFCWTGQRQLDHRAASLSTWASTRASRSPKRLSACTCMPMAMSASVPPGDFGAKPRRKLITWETPQGRGTLSRCPRTCSTRTSTRA